MLDDRKSAILRAVVQTYIETAQPVGSSHVVESAEVGVSAATVRNEMTVLEREGYLVQPHTSAGRVPTEKGYRFFVDHLDASELDGGHARTVRSFFSHAHGELEEMLQSTSRMLSKLTATTAVVVGGPADTTQVRSVQLVAISPRVVLVVVVTSAGAVLKRSMELAEDLHEEVLSRASGVLNDEIKDSRISSIPFPAPTGLTAVDELVGAGRAAVEAMFDDGARTVYVEGASNIAGAFDVTSTLQEILRLLEQQIAVVTLLNDVIDRGLTVAIGSETGMESLSECSLVVAPYLVGNEPVGTIGVLGPTRMNYQETIAAVAVVAQRLSRLLTQG